MSSERLFVSMRLVGRVRGPGQQLQPERRTFDGQDCRTEQTNELIIENILILNFVRNVFHIFGNPNLSTIAYISSFAILIVLLFQC